jgi:hypothetical protein
MWTLSNSNREATMFASDASYPIALTRPKAVGRLHSGAGYDPQPGTEKTSLRDSTPVGEFTNGVGRKQAALHDKANAKAAKDAVVEV